MLFYSGTTSGKCIFIDLKKEFGTEYFKSLTKYGSYFYFCKALLKSYTKWWQRNLIIKHEGFVVFTSTFFLRGRIIFRHIKVEECYTFSLICLSVSVTNIEELGSLALIFVCAPCKAGKNVEWSKAGFKQPIRGATSLVIRKYGSYKYIIKIIYIMILFQ